ncbi:heterokaryon incompatibility protein-domain-containing protein [Echria macrotheca]|uniref:Heterokaryon incompatibility protein-domain-containing protein n=1 Tax=Echria macrotheca TaxID=438768 RepID=A0AAJ0BEZ1_9PEZI|nr:heterokaryon incompatibility protein-domain-containing protein [Echria macrotheca]
MHLINTTTLSLETFHDNEIPPYAILSHTWGEDHEELSYQDLAAGKITDPPNLGMTKLRGTCKQAQKDGIKYAWIDSCCINKEDGIELSIAINSMFRWYRRAVVCYVYLADVPATDKPRDKKGSAFQQSRWFERGWTLQELIAPRRVSFFHSEWGLLGTKTNLKNVLSSITGVPREFLLHKKDLYKGSVAQRMSWAAKRQTRLPEDLAYCLMGMFNVSMDMRYGEGGQKAFIRLQESIFERTGDESMLAWGLDARSTATAGGVLASMPSDFISSGHVVPGDRTTLMSPPPRIEEENLYIHAPLHILPTDEMYALLNCQPGRSTSGEHQQRTRRLLFSSLLRKSVANQVIGIPLAPVGSTTQPDVPVHSYVRKPGVPAKYFPRKVYDEASQLEPISIKVYSVWDSIAGVKPLPHYGNSPLLERGSAGATGNK